MPSTLVDKVALGPTRARPLGVSGDFTESPIQPLGPDKTCNITMSLAQASPIRQGGIRHDGR